MFDHGGLDLSLLLTEKDVDECRLIFAAPRLSSELIDGESC